MRVLRTTCVVLLTSLALAAWAGGISVTDDRGLAISMKQPPRRIVSLLPSATEATCVLQACERLVGVDRFSDWPEQARSLPDVGGLEDAQLERIVALRPDLVLAGPFARVIDRLEALDIPVLVLHTENLVDVRRTLESLAQALGMPGAGEAHWQRMNRRIDAAAARVPASMRGQRVYLEVAGGPFAAGEASFVGEMLGRLALGNIVPAHLGAFPKLNPEYVVRARPDLVMASARDFDALAARPGWRNVEALRDGRYCRFADDEFALLLRPGPRLGEAAEAIVACLVDLERASR